MASPCILIVDDSAIIRKAVTNHLAPLNAEILHAEDGVVGLEIAHNHTPDLIITDVEMPRMDGFALCESLKSHEKVRGIPVIILSSLESDRDIERGFNAGAAEYIPKTEATHNLKNTVERILKKSRFHKHQHILVVDDSMVVRNLVASGLQKAGFQVSWAENGREGLKKLRSIRPELILSDITMPEMDGMEFCQKVQADPDLSGIPFVTMSSISDRAVMHRMLQRGAVSYIVKPFNIEQLVINVDKILSDHFLLLIKERERLAGERALMLQSISSLVVALEARDQYTRGHSEAVADILTHLGQFFQTTDEEIENLTIAGRLHDIGKIGVPDRILLKPGKLTEAEYRAVQSHPTVGANILRSISSLAPIIPIILHHHERFDGKGYPEGLKGAKIPFWARMAAVADTYHALISDRPYRRGMSKERALEIIREVRGTQLCPDCVDAFLLIITGDSWGFDRSGGHSVGPSAVA